MALTTVNQTAEIIPFGAAAKGVQRRIAVQDMDPTKQLHANVDRILKLRPGMLPYLGMLVRNVLVHTERAAQPRNGGGKL